MNIVNHISSSLILLVLFSFLIIGIALYGKFLLKREIAILFLIPTWILATISAHLVDKYTNQPIWGFLIGIIVFLFGYIVITVFRSK